MKRTLLYIILFLNSLYLFSKERINLFPEKKEIKYDTTRITDLTDKLNIYTGFLGKIHTIELNNSDINNKLSLEPNGKTSIGLGFNYKWLGLGIGFSPGFMNTDNEIYGNTDRLDTQLNIYTRSFGVDAYFQYYNGFYLKNPDNFMEWTSESFPLRSDLQSYSFGLSTYFFTNNKCFSYKAAYKRNQIQKKSAGSLIYGAYFNANIVKAPGGFIPEELPDSLTNYYNLDAYYTNSFGGSIGYTYTLVFFKRLYLNASLVPAIGYRNSEFRFGDQNSKTDLDLTLSLTTRFALGYEGKHLYAGLTFVSFIDSYNYESISISSSTGNVRLIIGKRFNVNRRN
ncbi:MAG: DUF4421 family protein [Bacteroidales bacterium]|nr:DUF4421 family protein [Bacteroidales bacterium]